MYTCASCTVKACMHPKGDKEPPRNCPMQDQTFFAEIQPCYGLEENSNFYVTASEMESAGYGQWSRLKETMVFCKQMGYERVGLAFCVGLAREAAVIDRLFRQNGIQTVSVACKAGGISKEEAGIREEGKLRPYQFEAMCNPIAQAMLLNREKTEFNVAVGLCVGHDSLLYKYAQAPVTTLIAKDRALAHNPAGAVYCAEGYFKAKLTL